MKSMQTYYRRYIAHVRRNARCFKSLISLFTLLLPPITPELYRAPLIYEDLDVKYSKRILDLRECAWIACISIVSLLSENNIIIDPQQVHTDLSFKMIVEEKNNVNASIFDILRYRSNIDEKVIENLISLESTRLLVSTLNKLLIEFQKLIRLACERKLWTCKKSGVQQ